MNGKKGLPQPHTHTQPRSVRAHGHRTHTQIAYISFSVVAVDGILSVYRRCTAARQTGKHRQSAWLAFDFLASIIAFFYLFIFVFLFISKQKIAISLRAFAFMFHPSVCSACVCFCIFIFGTNERWRSILMLLPTSFLACCIVSIFYSACASWDWLWVSITTKTYTHTQQRPEIN